MSNTKTILITGASSGIGLATFSETLGGIHTFGAKGVPERRELGPVGASGALTAMEAIR